MDVQYTRNGENTSIKVVLRETADAEDVSQVASALETGKILGLPFYSLPALEKALSTVRKEEEYEVTWRCILSALQALDCVIRRAFGRKFLHKERFDK